MNKIDFKKLIPYVTGIIIFMLVTFIYFNPVFKGKVINQSDIRAYKGMSKEIKDFRERTGEDALWTNSMFGGMPAYQISVSHSANLLNHVHNLLQFGMPRPAGTVMLYLIGFFILLLILRVNPWLSIIGAIAFAFSSYFIIIFEPGHNTKAIAIGYMAPVLAGIILTYRGKLLWGALLTALFLGLEIKANHLQITYYLMFVVLIYGIYELINAIKEKQLLDFTKKTAVLFIALAFALGANITNLWTTYEYSKSTIRGKSELTSKGEVRTSGVDKDYATQWSYGKQETFSLMIPNIKGGGTNYISSSPKALDKVDRQYKQMVGQQNHYWGDQPFMNGPVYAGAIIMFFFVLGMLILRGRLKWILFTATVLSILLAWGKNFMPLTSFFLDYFPLYNKFRAVSMTLVIAEFCIPIIALLAINKLVKEPESIKKNMKAFWIASGSTAGLSILFFLMPDVFFSFFSQLEVQSFARYRGTPNADQVEMLMAGMKTARISIFRAEVMRTIAFIGLAIIGSWLLIKNKIKANYFIIIIGILISVDMISVAYRYLNKEDYIRKNRIDIPVQMSNADKQILTDKDPNYRVLNFTTDAFMESHTSFYHKSTGGYHGAKLRRYQEMIENHFTVEMQQFINVLSNNPTAASVETVMREMQTINMMNTKYFIVDPNNAPISNPYSFGNAWFVNNVKIVKNADEEITALKEVDLRNTAVIDERFGPSSIQNSLGFDSTASIMLTKYEPNHLVYQSSTNKDQVAVFSEIFYKPGWNAYIDGQEIDHVRANYVLRSLRVPAGEHQIEFKFEPRSYLVGSKISFIASLLIILAVLGMLGWESKKMIQKKD